MYAIAPLSTLLSFACGSMHCFIASFCSFCVDHYVSIAIVVALKGDNEK